MLNLKHLYYFHVFAQEGSTTKAAKRLRISSPALSNQLKDLDSFIGSPLTQRVDGKVVLTQHGEIVQHYTDRMFTAYEELRTKVSSSGGLNSNQFKVGVCNIIGARFTFDLLALFENFNLSLSSDVRVSFDSADFVFESFKNSQLDFAIGAFGQSQGENQKWISQHLTFPVRLFAQSELLNEEQDVIKIIKLMNHKKIPMIMPMHSSVLRDETEKYLTSLSVSPEKIIECNHADGIVQLIERGMAIGFVPTPCLLDFKQAKILSVLGPKEGCWMHQISVYMENDFEGNENLYPIRSNLDEYFASNTKFT